MLLNDYFKQLDKKVYFKSIKDDSRLVKKNDIFVCIKGLTSDGNLYIAQAIENGACFIISERLIKNFPSLCVSNTQEVLNSMLNFYYQNHHKLNKVAITGTDGKTTTSSLIYKILNNVSNPILISSNGIYYKKNRYKTINTTPSNTILYESLEYAYNTKSKYAVIEMSSEGILNNRGMFLKFNGIVLTNITHEHLNTHKTMKNYINTKLKLLDNLKDDGIVVINKDMKYYKYVKNHINHKIITYGINSGDYKALNIHLSFTKTIFDLYYKNYYIGQIESSLFGEYNIYNMLASISYLYEIGIPFKIIKQTFNEYIHIEGRFEYLYYKNRHFIIDYAHTPNGIKSTLESIKKVSNGNIYSILGCMGGKDKTKRPLMGLYASLNSKNVIFTSEDPKDESIFNIINNLSKKVKDNYYITLFRDDAIKLGISLLKDNDILIIFGKGLENKEIYYNFKFKGSDKDILDNLLKS